MEVIERNARVQTQIIDDLLDMSRIISGKIHLQHRRVDLGDVIAAALETVRPTADAKDVTIALDLDIPSREVDGDPGRLQQVIWNLLANAVKFTPKGRTVRVELRDLGGRVAIEVSDEGIGIEPEFLPHIFERFRQADSTTTRRHGGLGLGLAIVKQLVELHGGSVTATSPGTGLGALFTVILPLAADGIGTAPQADDAGGMALDGMRILVVDDEADARELVARVLLQYGATVTTAGSAREALDALGGSRHDLIISDIGMPVEDGYLLIHRVRSLPREHGGDIPAIALSAFARPEDAMRARSSGFQAHIAKPFDTLQLLQTVAALLRERGAGG
jgi:CheY-like chemotaxis protein